MNGVTQMKDLLKSLPHLIMAIVVIAASVILAETHIITGGEAIGLIGMGSGFTLGGTVASGSISTAATAAVDVSHSASTLAQTPTSTPSNQSPETATEPVTTTNPPITPSA